MAITLTQTNVNFKGSKIERFAKIKVRLFTSNKRAEMEAHCDESDYYKGDDTIYRDFLFVDLDSYKDGFIKLSSLYREGDFQYREVSKRKEVFVYQFPLTQDEFEALSKQDTVEVEMYVAAPRGDEKVIRRMIWTGKTDNFIALRRNHSERNFSNPDHNLAIWFFNGAFDYSSRIAPTPCDTWGPEKLKDVKEYLKSEIIEYVDNTPAPKKAKC